MIILRWTLPALAAAFLFATGATTHATATITGELKQWHKITLTLDGPEASETNEHPNPFTDYRMVVAFTHESARHQVPGYFAADGDAANTSARSGNKWRAHLSPDRPGKWTYAVSFVEGPNTTVTGAAGKPVSRCDGTTGSFIVGASDKQAPDLRARGRLDYVGKRYLRFAGSGEYFLKAGADSPENLLAYADFDGTVSAKKTGTLRPGEAASTALKTWQPHVRDWRPGDPTWQRDKGKGLIGALNYLAAKRCNAFSFLTYNAGGDGDDVWPFVSRNDKSHYDCSKLDQWQIVFDHASRLGLFCHFKTQETENDDMKGPGAAQSLDGGDLGPERKLYYRELIARFGYLLALNWNLGEENTQTPAQQQAAAQFFHETDPAHHPVVIHTYPDQQDKVYSQLLGERSLLSGASLQNGWDTAHQRVLKWVGDSEKSLRPWVVANDEQNPASLGVPPDPGYEGFGGSAREKGTDVPYDLHSVRKHTLWGTLMAGGQGVEYYFGYTLQANDLRCEDFRSRDQSWAYCGIALGFFQEHRIPFWEMANADALVGNEKNRNDRYCFAQRGQCYLVYLPNGGTTELDLRGVAGNFVVKWFNPRQGGPLADGTVRQIEGGSTISLGQPPAEAGQDWLAMVRSK